MAYDDDAYQNCNPDDPRKCNKLEKRISLGFSWQS